MPTDVVMPQMGESIAESVDRPLDQEGWRRRRAGRAALRDLTDKVDAEIPSPVAGVVTEIRANEGETVPVNSVVAVIGPAEGATASTNISPAARPTTEAPGQSSGSANDAEAGQTPPRTQAQVLQEPVAKPEAMSGDAPPRAAGASASLEERIRQRSSPLVRKIAKEHQVDISQIQGTGIAGRVTKNDILGFIGGAGEIPPPPPAAAGPARPQLVASAGRPDRVEGKGPARPAPAARQTPSGQASGAGLVGQVVPMSVMRKRIAEHMIASRRTSAHVHSVFEVNFGRVAQVRDSKKLEDGAPARSSRTCPSS